MTQENYIPPLLQLIQNQGFNQKTLAKKAGIDPGTLSKIIHGITRNPDIKTLQQLADILQVSLTEIREIIDSNNHEEYHHYWGEAPDVSSGFCGRTDELTKLETWITKEKCRLIAITTAIPKSGKTYLATKLAQKICKKFNYVLWISLKNAPSLNEIVISLNQILPEQAKPPELFNNRVSYIINCLREYRCLLILDGVETILQKTNLDNNIYPLHYQPEYTEYGELFKQVGESAHNSCLLLTSQEKPKEIFDLERKPIPVRSLNLKGFKEDEKIFADILKYKDIKLTKLTPEWQEIIKLCGGNLWLFNLVADTILTLHSGNVSQYLDYSTLVESEYKYELEQCFNRLSYLEKNVMYSLAISYQTNDNQPISIRELISQFQEFTSSSDISHAVKSLKHRSFLEQSMNYELTVQSEMLIRYTRKRFIDDLCQDIARFIKTHNPNELEVLLTHDLTKSHHSSLLKSIQRELQQYLSKDKTLTEHLNLMLSVLSTLPSIGYTQNNIRYLVDTNLEKFTPLSS